MTGGAAGGRAAGAAGGAAGDTAATGPVAVLIGPPGAGKSTVGALVAGLLGVGFLDTDSVVEKVAGKPVGDIFIEDGEPVFRDLERAAVARTLAGHPGILALGGGAVMDAATRRLLAGRRVVYLETGFAAAAHRAGLDAPRPLLVGNPRARLKELLEARLPVYRALASVTVTTDDRSPQEIADEVAGALTAAIAAEAGEGAGAPGDVAALPDAARDGSGRDGSGADGSGAGAASGDAASGGGAGGDGAVGDREGEGGSRPGSSR